MGKAADGMGQKMSKKVFDFVIMGMACSYEKMLYKLSEGGKV